MKFSCNLIQTEVGRSFRHTLAFLRSRMQFKTNGLLSFPTGGTNSLPDRLDLEVQDTEISLIAIDDVAACPGLLMIKCCSIDTSNSHFFLSLNPILLVLHSASFNWCNDAKSYVLSRMVPEHLSLDEDDLFDFVLDSIRLVRRCLSTSSMREALI